MSKNGTAYKNYRIHHRGMIKAGLEVLCALCKKPIVDRNEFSVDHIIPRSKGGGNTLSNYQPTHFLCNLKKADTLADPTPVHEKGDV